ncbi:MAG: hypothetical protein NVS2B12_18190 [Ktedonobacteraceae bacterium]
MSNNQPYPPDPRQRGYTQPPMNQSMDSDPYANTIESENINGAYAQSQQQRYVDPAGNYVENRSEVYRDPNQSRANTRYWIATVTYFILGVLEIILALRLFFRLLGANMDNSFITFLYNLSHAFVAPFNGIFNDQAIGTHSVFELSTIIAMLIYALIAWGIVSLGRVIFAPVISGERRVDTTRRRS